MPETLENCMTCKLMTMEWYQVHKSKKETCGLKLPQTIIYNAKENVCCYYQKTVKT